MSVLPGRPNLDQLRRQARELHRAATAGDESAARRVRAVSATLTLSAAQLAIAREYGFASWPKLRAGVAQRRATPDEARQDSPGDSPKSWQEMREWCARLLRSRTGQQDGTVHRNVHAALFTQSKELPTLVMPGNPWLVTAPVPGDAPAARWEATVTVRHGDDGYDFSGPFVRGARDDRHLGLAWGDLPGDGTLRSFRGAKLRLVDVPPALIAEAMRPGHRLVARVRLTDAKGNPVCARLHPPYIAWSAEPSTPGDRRRHA